MLGLLGLALVFPITYLNPSALADPSPADAPLLNTTSFVANAVSHYQPKDLDLQGRAARLSFNARLLAQDEKCEDTPRSQTVSQKFWEIQLQKSLVAGLTAEAQVYQNTWSRAWLPSIEKIHRTLSERTLSSNVEDIRRYLARTKESGITAILESAASHRISQDTVPVVRAFYELLSATSEHELSERHERVSGQLNVNQKILLLQLLGERYNATYDNPRAAAVTGTPSNPWSIFKNAKLNTNNNVWDSRVVEKVKQAEESGVWPDNMPITQAEYTGICRDISFTLAKHAKSLGFDNPRVLSYGFLRPWDSGETNAYHSTVIFNEKGKPGAVYKLNYGDILTGFQGSASSRLFQGDSDAAMGYRLFGLDGKQESVQTSELKGLIETGMGINSSTHDPLFFSKQTVSTGIIHLSPSPSGPNLRVFSGQDELGRSIQGGGVTTNYGQATLFPGIFAIGGASVPSNIHSELGFGTLFFRWDQDALSPWIGNSTTHLRLEGKSMLEGSMATRGNTTTMFQGDARFQLGPRVDAQTADGKYKTTNSVTIQGSLAPNNVTQGGGDPSVIGMALNHVVAQSSHTLAISQEGEAFITAAALALCSHIGCAGKAELSVLFKDTLQSLIRIEGPLTPELPKYVSGGTARISAQMMFDLLRQYGVRLSVKGFREINPDPGSSADTGVNGSVIIEH